MRRKSSSAFASLAMSCEGVAGALGCKATSALRMVMAKEDVLRGARGVAPTKHGCAHSHLRKTKNPAWNSSRVQRAQCATLGINVQVIRILNKGRN